MIINASSFSLLGLTKSVAGGLASERAPIPTFEVDVSPAIIFPMLTLLLAALVKKLSDKPEPIISMFLLPETPAPARLPMYTLKLPLVSEAA